MGDRDGRAYGGVRRCFRWPKFRRLIGGGSSGDLDSSPSVIDPRLRQLPVRRRHHREHRLELRLAAGIPNANFGKDGDHIQVSPPLTISESEIDELLDALDAALAAV